LKTTPYSEWGSRKGSTTSLRVCGEAETVDDALGRVPSCQPDLAIVDLSLKESNGMDLISSIRA